MVAGLKDIYCEPITEPEEKQYIMNDQRDVDKTIYIDQPTNIYA